MVSISNLNFRVVLIGIFLLLIISLNVCSQPLAKYKNKFVGNIIANGNNIRPNFHLYWNQVTAENAGKWGSVEGTPGNYNWNQLDKIYNYAKTNNFIYKHHTLIWGNQQPSFLSSMDSAQQYQEVENWVKASGERYPEAELCDVVNEPLHAPPVYKEALGGDGITGWDWVIKSFELARKYWSPNTKLLINEYSVINDGSANSNYLQLINLLKERGLVDGIGIQCHNFEVNGGASVNTLNTNLNNLAATGLPIYISEFDINEANDNTQLQKYQSIFPTLYENSAVAGITLWGYIQYEIWQANAYLLTDRYVERPAMQWLRNYLLSPFKPILISPVSATEEPVNTLLIWHASDSATAYNVQVSLVRSFSTTIIDTVVTDTVFQLNNLNENTTYYWRVNASNDRGISDFTAYASFTTVSSTDIIENLVLKGDFLLSQNFPNPFNSSTIISYFVPKRIYIKLEILNLFGEKIETIVDGTYQPGNYAVNYSAQNLPSGVYLYRLTAENYIKTKKFVLLK